MITKLARLIGLGVLIALAIACNQGGETPGEDEVLISLTDLIIVPGYESVAAETGEMRAALDTLCANPSEETLAAAQQTWRDTRVPWMRSEATWMGPVMDRRSLGIMDWPLVEPERIENMLENTPATTPDDIRFTLSSTQRGMGAIEYLIFADDSVEALSGSDPTRCAFLTSLGEVVAVEADAVKEEWTTGIERDTPYKDFFTDRGSASLLTGQAVAELVRTQVFLIRTIVDMRLAAAMGLRPDGPDLELLPGGKGEHALEDLRNQILGMRDMYVGHDSNEGYGISDIVRELSVETDDRMKQNFDDALAAIDEVDVPLRRALSERPDQMREVYDRLSNLQRTLSTEVVSLLGVSVGFSDTDGDSLR